MVKQIFIPFPSPQQYYTEFQKVFNKDKDKVKISSQLTNKQNNNTKKTVIGLD